MQSVFASKFGTLASLPYLPFSDTKHGKYQYVRRNLSSTDHMFAMIRFLQDSKLSKPSEPSEPSKEQMMEDIFRFFDEDQDPRRMLQGALDVFLWYPAANS